MTSRRALALIFVASLAACSSQRSEEDLLASAKTRMEQKDIAGASIELKNLLQKNPDSAVGRHLFGKALLEAEDPAGAEIELRRAMELGAPQDQVAPLLAQALVQTGQTRKAVTELGDVQLADPKAMSALQQQLAMAQLAQGNMAQAQNAATRALLLTPQAEGAVLADARIKFITGAADAAVAALDEQLKRDPKASKVLQLKAEVLLSRGKTEEAEALFAQVLTLDAANFDARAALVRLAFGRNELDAAAKLVDAMPGAVANKPQGRFLQAQLALARNDAAKAKELALPLLKVMPNYLPLLRLAAGAHQQLGELADAENLLNQSLKLAPDNLGLRRQFASLQLQRRAPAKTLETLRPLLEGGKADAETLLLAGKAQLMQGNFEAADQAFGEAAKKRPDDSKTQAALALTALARDGAAPNAGAKVKADAALAQLRDLAAKDSGSSYDLMLVNALIRRQDFTGAFAALDKLAPKMKDSAVPDGLRGRLHLVRKDTAAARAAFEASLKADPGYLPSALGLVAIDLQAKKPEDAVKRMEAFVASQKASPQARLALAELLVQTQAPVQRVTDVLTMAVREEPSEPSLRIALIDYLLRVGDIKAASQAAQEASAALPVNPDLLERLARTQLASGDKAQASKTYSRLTALSPSRAHGWLGLAQLRFVDKDYDGAEREIKRALQAEPESMLAQRLLIQLAIRQGRTEQALAALHERQKKYPQESYAFVAEADMELSRQRPEAAINLLRKAVALPQAGDAAPRLMAALLAARKRDEALAFEKQWMQAHPQDDLFAGAAADLLLAHGDLEGALSRYETLLERKPDTVSLINNVAWLRSKTGKQGARALAERGLKLKPDDGALRDTYATVLANEKDFSKALSMQRQLIIEQPDQPGYKLTLAQILIQSGDKAAARTELESLARLGDKFRQHKDVQALLKTL